MELNFVESGRPIFRASSALDRGTFSIHFNGGTSIAELLFRTINSANQFSTHGAVADWCEELLQQILVQASSSIDKSITKVYLQLDCSLAGIEDVKTAMKPLETTFLHREINGVMTEPCEIAGFTRKVSLGQ